MVLLWATRVLLLNYSGPYCKFRVLVFLCSYPQVLKTLNTGEGQRKVSGGALQELKQVLQQAEASMKLYNLTKKPLVLHNFHDMKENIITCKKYKCKIALPIARCFCAHAAQSALKDGDIKTAVLIGQYWPVPEEASEFGAEQGEAFVVDTPRISKLMPTLQDEEEANETPQEKPTIPADVMVWEQSQAYDESTRTFGEKYLRWWQNEVLYGILQTDLTIVASYFQTLLFNRFQQMIEPGYTNGTLAFLQCDKVHKYAAAWLGIMGDAIFDEGTLQMYHDIFVDVLSEDGQIFATLAAQARESEVFKEREIFLNSVADTKVENHEAINAFLNLHPDDMNTVKLVELCELVTEIDGAIRPEAWGPLLVLQIAALENGIEPAISPASILDEEAKYILLQEYAPIIQKLKPGQNENLATRISMLKTKVAACHRKSSSEAGVIYIKHCVEMGTVGALVHDLFKENLNNIENIVPIFRDLYELGNDAVKYMAEAFPGIASKDDNERQGALEVVGRLSDNLELICTRLEKANKAHPISHSKINTLLARGQQVTLAGATWLNNSPSTDLDFHRLNKAFIEFSQIYKFFKKSEDLCGVLVKAILTGSSGEVP